jgi:hypothetical protein
MASPGSYIYPGNSRYNATSRASSGLDANFDPLQLISGHATKSMSTCYIDVQWSKSLLWGGDRFHADAEYTFLENDDIGHREFGVNHK